MLHDLKLIGTETQMRRSPIQITIQINGASADVQSEVVNPNTEFRADMNLKAAIDALADSYSDEAMRLAGEGHGQKTRAAKLLGFSNYQAFQYWLKRRERRADPRN